MRYETPARKEWDLKMKLADYIRDNSYCTAEDIIHDHKRYDEYKITKTLIQLEFIGLITMNEDGCYRYIGNEGGLVDGRYNKLNK